MRWLSLRHRVWLIAAAPRGGGGGAIAAATAAAGAGGGSGAADDYDDLACPAHAPEVVAMAAFAVVGFLVPLALLWLGEMHYRCVFARSRGPRALLRGPAALRWSSPERARTAGIALLFSTVFALSLIDAAAESLF
jgi:hypothetical protein